MAAGKPRVLVVDDFEELRQLIGIYISDMGLELDMAENGLIACEKAEKNDFDIIFMDIQMPVMNGIEAVAKLRARNFKKPIVALTAHVTAEDREKYLGNGFDDFLGKPFTEDELKSIFTKFHLL